MPSSYHRPETSALRADLGKLDTTLKGNQFIIGSVDDVYRAIDIPHPIGFGGVGSVTVHGGLLVKANL